jgi:hypothetical protein
MIPLSEHYAENSQEAVVTLEAERAGTYPTGSSPIGLSKLSEIRNERGRTALVSKRIRSYSNRSGPEKTKEFVFQRTGRSEQGINNTHSAVSLCMYVCEGCGQARD